jgi:acyl carrier protein
MLPTDDRRDGRRSLARRLDLRSGDGHNARVTHDDVSAQIKDAVARITGLPVASIADDASFRGDLSLDSLSLLELVVHVEYSFRIKVPEADLGGLETVADVADYVRARLAAGR